MLMQKYGIEVGGDDGKQEFDQIASFRRFLLFARDTIRWRKPMDPGHSLVGDVRPCVDLHRQWRAVRSDFLDRGFQ